MNIKEFLETLDGEGLRIVSWRDLKACLEDMDCLLDSELEILPPENDHEEWEDY